MPPIDDNTLLAIRDEIISFTENEDQVLRDKFNRGIFFMPELAFVYGLGKTIALRAAKIFPGRKVEWEREIKVGQGGPCDLILDIADVGRIVFEFKICGTMESYFQDVEKLKFQVGDHATRLFCALSNVFQKDLPADDRIKKMEQNYTYIKRVGELHNFPTWDSYSTPVHCVIGLWVVS
jgi:hypothetical protein